MSTIRFLLLILLFSLPVFADEEAEQEAEESSNVAPEWTLKKDDTVYGTPQLTGKPYVIHFWATWCPYCKRLQPGLDSVSRDYKDDGIATYAISFWENPRANPEREMVNRGLGLKVLVKGDDVAKSFGVQGTPTTVFINHDGEIISRLNTSDPNDPQLRLAYEALLDGFEKSKQPKPKNEEETTEN